MFTIAEQRLTVMAPVREGKEPQVAFTLEFSTNPADAARKRLRLIPGDGETPACECEWHAGGKEPEVGPVWQAPDRQPFDHRPASQATADELAAMTPAERTLHEKDHFVAPEKPAGEPEKGKGVDKSDETVDPRRKPR